MFLPVEYLITLMYTVDAISQAFLKGNNVKKQARSGSAFQQANQRFNDVVT